jgi:transcriptional regulator
MYIRDTHAERDPAALAAFVRANPFGALTTSIPHPTIDTLQSTHIVWVLDDGPSPTGLVLRGHMARANPQSKAIIDALKAEGKGNGELADDVLVLFTSTTHSYVTPRWMTDSKESTGKVTPTWQFSAVQAYGRPRIYHSRSEEERDETDGWLRRMVSDLTDQEEGKVTDEGWSLDEAPEKYTATLLKGIIGLEVPVRKIEGRFKVGQDETDGDWAGIVKGFQGEGTKLGDDMTHAMLERGTGRPGRGGCPLGA